jgi:hypothetical protein
MLNLSPAASPDHSDVGEEEDNRVPDAEAGSCGPDEALGSGGLQVRLGIERIKKCIVIVSVSDRKVFQTLSDKNRKLYCIKNKYWRIRRWRCFY